jgi:hypothetical protein
LPWARPDSKTQVFFFFDLLAGKLFIFCI